MFYHPGIPRGIYRVLQWVFTVMFAVHMKNIVRFIFLGRLLGVLGRYVWGSLWCWRCLCEIAEPRVEGEIWGPSGGLLTISCILASGLRYRYYASKAFLPVTNCRHNRFPPSPPTASSRLRYRYNTKQAMCMYNVTFRRVRVTTVAVEKQYVLHIVTVRL